MAGIVSDEVSLLPGPLALHGLSVEGVNRCVHCGLCLASCPTFAELGTEMDSPRGRIYLVKSLAEGRIALSDSTVRHLGLCLDCRACETVCPAGVPYGELIEVAKAEIERQRPGGPLRRGFRWLSFRMLGSPAALRLAAGVLGLYQASGLQRLVRASRLGRLLPGTLSMWEALLPRLPSRAARAPLPPVVPADGIHRARVAMLTGCVQSVVFGDDNRATARVLARNGCEVAVPRDQGCCGALHAHGGDLAGARALARRTIERFESAGPVDAVVVNTSGCGAHMKAYGRLLGDDPAWAERARRFAGLVADVSEFLAREPLAGPLRPVPMTVTYHDPCHVVHGQRIRAAPRRLLAQIPGLRLVELPESDWCCGSAGLYNLTQPEMATRLLQRKVRHILSTGAEAVVTANPGCILQIQAGLRAQASPVRVLHLVEVLARAYSSEGASGSPR